MLAANTQPNIEEIRYPTMVSPKIDGVRACVQNGKLVSRSLKDSLNRWVTKVLSHPAFEGFDGELTVIGDKWNDFNHNQSQFMTQAGQPKFIYWVFDDISRGDMTALIRKGQLEQRVDLANNLMPELCEVRCVAQHLVNHPIDVLNKYETFRDLGYEGLIICDPYAKYKHGRSTLKQGIMLKLKPVEDDEATIIGMEELMHNEDAGNSKCQAHLVPGGMLGALVVSWKGKQFKIGTGFDHEQRREMWNNAKDYMGKLATFKYMELSKYGIPRGPVFKGIRSKADV